MKYKTKADDDLGSIAQRAGLVSWKYLYEINKEVIGDNPDLLKPGTILEIPQWDSTSGDEKIEEKGVSAFSYTGGLRYRYPWVPFSLTLTQGAEPSKAFEEEREVVIEIPRGGEAFYTGTMQQANELQLLMPDTDSVNIGIAGYPLKIGETLHIHPDDSIDAGRGQQ